MALRAPTIAATGAHETGSFVGLHGTKLFEQSWHPGGKTKAVIVIHHGLKSHSEHYAGFAERATGLGYGVYAYDMRGHGRSEGPRATLDDFEDLVTDLDTFLKKVQEREPNLPIFLVGHSAGGAVATLYVEERRPPHPKVAGLVLLAPGLRVEQPLPVVAAVPLTSATNPNFPAVDTPNELFSRDPAQKKAMDDDPLIYQSPGPARTAGGLFGAIEKVWMHPEAVDVPLLGLHGTGDKITDPRGTAELVARAGTRDKKLLLYKGLFHDLMHEPEKDQVQDDIFAWLKARH